MRTFFVDGYFEDNPASFRQQTMKALLVLLFCVCIVNGGVITAASSGKWSSSETWMGGVIPGDRDSVIIGAGVSVSFDTNSSKIDYIRVDAGGSFTFDNGLGIKDTPLVLTVETLLVAGYMEIGTESALFTRKASIVLMNYEVPVLRNQDGMIPTLLVEPYGKKVLGVYDSGILEIHAAGRNPAWNRIDGTAQVGATSLTVACDIDWQVGDEIVVSSTDFEPNQAERRIITKVEGRIVSFDEPLRYMHWGQNMTYNGFHVDERAEIAVLTSNVAIRGDMVNSAVYNSTQEPVYAGFDEYMQFGGHTFVYENATAHIQGIEISHLGQGGRLGRYPLHWHLVNNGTGQYAKRVLAHDLYLRCISIHSTSNVLVQDMVCFETYGHGYYLEVGDETGNVFDHNLAITGHDVGYEFDNYLKYTTLGAYKFPDCSAHPTELGLRIEYTDYIAAAFWIVNIQNVFINNAVSGYRYGYWIRTWYLPEEPGYPCVTQCGCAGQSDGSKLDQNAQGIVFENNVAHSIILVGLWIKEIWNPGNPYRFVEAPNPEMFFGYTGYKCQLGMSFYSCSHFAFDNMVVADCLEGLNGEWNIDQSLNYTITNSIFIGETENVGTCNNSNPTTLIIESNAVGNINLAACLPVNCSAIHPNTERSWRPNDAASWLLRLSAGLMHLDNVTFMNSLPNCLQQTPGQWSNWFGSVVGPHRINGAMPMNRLLNRIDFVNTTWNNSYTTVVDYSSADPGSYGSNDAGSSTYMAGFYDQDGSLPCSQPGAWWTYNNTGTHYIAPDCTWMSAYGMYQCPPFSGMWLSASYKDAGNNAVPATASWGCNQTLLAVRTFMDLRTDALPMILDTNYQPFTTHSGFTMNMRGSPGMWIQTVFQGMQEVSMYTAPSMDYWHRPPQTPGVDFFAECRCNKTFVKLWIPPFRVDIDYISGPAVWIDIALNESISCPSTDCSTPFPQPVLYDCNMERKVDNRVCPTIARGVPATASQTATSESDGKVNSPSTGAHHAPMGSLIFALVSFVLIFAQ